MQSPVSPLDFSRANVDSSWLFNIISSTFTCFLFLVFTKTPSRSKRMRIPVVLKTVGVGCYRSLLDGTVAITAISKYQAGRGVGGGA